MTPIGWIALAALIAGIWLGCWGIRANARLARLEGTVSALRARLEKPSFKVTVTVFPDWKAIVEKGLAGAEDRAKVEKYISGLKKLIHGQVFRYTGMFDGLSSTRYWWSSYQCEILDVPHLRGNLFDVDDILHPALSDIGVRGSELLGIYDITPAYIGYYRYQPEERVQRFEYLSRIPFDKILSFLLDVHANVGNLVMNGIRAFPKELEAELTQHGVQYHPESWMEYLKHTGREKFDEAVDLSMSGAVRNGGAEWARARGVEFYERETWSHTFRTQFLAVSIRMEFFDTSHDANPHPGREVVPLPVMARPT